MWKHFTGQHRKPCNPNVLLLKHSSSCPSPGGYHYSDSQGSHFYLSVDPKQSALASPFIAFGKNWLCISTEKKAYTQQIRENLQIPIGTPTPEGFRDSRCLFALRCENPPTLFQQNRIFMSGSASNTSSFGNFRLSHRSG